MDPTVIMCCFFSITALELFLFLFFAFVETLCRKGLLSTSNILGEGIGVNYKICRAGTL